MNRESDYLERQKELGIYAPPMLVIGVGGVGSWVAYFSVIAGCEKLVLVDPDKVEPSNLNRTPFQPKHIGKFKVHAMMEMLIERAQVLALPMNIEDVDRELVERFLGERYTTVDCRDSIAPLPSWVKLPTAVGGYDGDNFSIQYAQDVYNKTFGEVRYTITPSWVAPPVLVALMVLVPIWRGVFPKIGNFNIIEALGGVK